MKEKCILCEENVDISKIPGKGEYSVECSTCRNYIYDDCFKNSYLTLPKEERAMISAYTRESYEHNEDLPKLSDPDSLYDIIAKYKIKTIEEKLDNLILYLKKKSSYLGDNVAWDEKKDYPITYSPNPHEFTKIRELAKQRNLLYWKSRDSGLELSGDGWEMAEKLKKESEMELGKKREQFLIKLNKMSNSDVSEFIESMRIGEELGFDRKLTFSFVRYFDQKGFIILRTEAGDVISITTNGIDEVDRIQPEAVSPGLAEIDIEVLIKMEESSTLEFKSSFQWDVKKECRNEELSKEVIRTLAAFNNTDGGYLVIGVSDGKDIFGLEKDYGLFKHPNKKDFFLQTLCNVVENAISKEFVTLIDIEFHEIKDRDICRIKVKSGDRPVVVKESSKNEVFYIRIHNSEKRLSLSETISYIKTRWN